MLPCIFEGRNQCDPAIAGRADVPLPAGVLDALLFFGVLSGICGWVLMRIGWSAVGVFRPRRGPAAKRAWGSGDQGAHCRPLDSASLSLLFRRVAVG